MPHVEIRVGPLARRIEAVVGLRRVRHEILAVARIVSRVAERVAGGQAQPAPPPQGEACLERVVARGGGRLELVDVDEGIAARIRWSAVERSDAGPRIGLVDVAIAEQLAPEGPDVAG